MPRRREIFFWYKLIRRALEFFALATWLLFKQRFCEFGVSFNIGWLLDVANNNNSFCPWKFFYVSVAEYNAYVFSKIARFFKGRVFASNLAECHHFVPPFLKIVYPLCLHGM